MTVVIQLIKKRSVQSHRHIYSLDCHASLAMTIPFIRHTALDTVCVIDEYKETPIFIGVTYCFHGVISL